MRERTLTEAEQDGVEELVSEMLDRDLREIELHLQNARARETTGALSQDVTAAMAAIAALQRRLALLPK